MVAYSRTSPASSLASPPSARMLSVTAATPSGRRSMRARRQPSRASSSAMAAPIPEPAPVIRPAWPATGEVMCVLHRVFGVATRARPSIRQFNDAHCTKQEVVGMSHSTAELPVGMAGLRYPITQVSLAVRDLDKTMAEYHRAFGWVPWQVFDHV